MRIENPSSSSDLYLVNAISPEIIPCGAAEMLKVLLLPEAVKLPELMAKVYAAPTEENFKLEKVPN